MGCIASRSQIHAEHVESKEQINPPILAPTNNQTIDGANNQSIQSSHISVDGPNVVPPPRLSVPSEHSASLLSPDTPHRQLVTQLTQQSQSSVSANRAPVLTVHTSYHSMNQNNPLTHPYSLHTTRSSALSINQTSQASPSNETMLLKIARKLAAETKLSSIIQIIVQTIPELLDCDRCTFFMIDKEKNEFLIQKKTSSGKKKSFLNWIFGQRAPELPFLTGESELRLPFKGLAATVATTLTAIRIEDAHLDARFDPSMDRETGYRTRSMLGVPLIDSNGECIAVVQAINKNFIYQSGFDSADEALMLTFAAQAALAIRNSQLLSKTRSALQSADALLEITNVLASELKMEGLLSLICTKAQTLLGCQRCTVFLVDQEKQELYTSSSMSFGMGPSAVLQGEKDREKLLSFPIGRGIAGAVATSGQYINLPDVYLDPRFDRSVDKSTGFRTQSLMCLPIKNHRNEIVGVIQVMNKQRRSNASLLDHDDEVHHQSNNTMLIPATPSAAPMPSPNNRLNTQTVNQVVPFSAANVRLLTAFSSQAAVAIENSRLFTQTERALNQALAEQRNLRFMLSVTKNLFNDLSLQSILHTLIKQVHHLMKSDHVVFYLVDQSNKQYWLAKEDGKFVQNNNKQQDAGQMNPDDPRYQQEAQQTASSTAQRIDAGRGFAGEVIRTGQAVRLNTKAFHHPAFDCLIDQRGPHIPQSVLYCPIIGSLSDQPEANSTNQAPSILGVIGVWDVDNKGGFENGEEELLAAFCAQASVSITSSAAVSQIVLGSKGHSTDDSAASYLRAARGMKLVDHKIDRFEFDASDFVLHGLIGVGSYGEVYRATMVETNAIVAVKKFHVRALAADQLDAFCQEAGLMCQLQHPNVVNFIGAITAVSNLSLITEFCSKGSLADMLLDPTQGLTFRRRCQFALDAALGMHYLHKSNPVILHRDLKSDNLLVTDRNTIKVADFGLTRFLSESKQMSQVGTPMWMAPEIIQGTQYTQKADVYAFGIILWEMLTRLEPYEDKEPMQIVLQVVNEGLRPEMPSELEESPIVPLMRECWAQNPAQRPSFQQIVARLQEILTHETVDPSTGKSLYDATPHGILRTRNITLGVPRKTDFPSLTDIATRRAVELKRQQSDAETAEQKEYMERQRLRREQLELDEEEID